MNTSHLSLDKKLATSQTHLNWELKAFKNVLFS